MSKGSLISLYYKIEEESIKKYGEKTVVFLHKGKFYELYSMNPTFSKLCDLLNVACTRVNKKKPPSLDNPQMGGFPTNNIEKYIRILLDKNYSVVVVDEKIIGYDGKGNKKLEREVVRTVSPSTNIEAQESNPLVTIYIEDNIVAVSYIDLTNGKTILYTDCKWTIEYIRDVVVQTNPREIIFYFGSEKELTSLRDELSIFKENDKIIVQLKVIEKEVCKISYQNEFLDKIYKNKVIGITPIENLGLEKYPMTSVVLVLSLQFSFDHDSTIVSNLKHPEILCDEETLILSENCINQLHIPQLIKYVDFSCTAMGSRLIKERITYPSTSIETLSERYQKILLLQLKYQLLKTELSKIGDVDKFQRKLSSCKLQVSEMVSFYHTLNSILNTIEIYLTIDKGIIQPATFNNLKKLIGFINRTINIKDAEEMLFNTGIHKDLDSLRQEKVLLDIEFEEIRISISKLIIPNFKEGLDEPLKYGTANGSLYLIISKKYKDQLEGKTDLKTKSIQSECRISTDRIDEISARQTEIEEELVQLNEKYFYEFCRVLANNYSPTIIKLSKIIADIDFTYASCRLIEEYRFVLPKIAERQIINISGLRHPLIESQISVSYVANDVHFNDNNLGILLFGENYSGKTSYIRSVGIAFVLAQAGLPVPASSMVYTPITRIIIKISLGDNYERSQSTFTREVQKMKEMVECTNEKSLILADELCSGTEINSALSLVASTILSIVKRNCRFIFTTHYHDLVNIPQISELTSLRVYHMKVSIASGKQIFERLLQSGKCNDIYGIEVAQYMKMPQQFIHQAYLIRKELMGIRGVVSTKPSKYHKDVYMTECRICKSIKDLHTHHIIFQSEFKGKMKNFKNNLIVLCDECHVKVHQNEINVNGFIQTSEGEELLGPSAP